jgi:hypothetical protein
MMADVRRLCVDHVSRREDPFGPLALGKPDEDVRAVLTSVITP